MVPSKMFICATSLFFFLLPLLVQDGNCENICTIDRTGSAYYLYKLFGIPQFFTHIAMTFFHFSFRIPIVTILWYPPSGRAVKITRYTAYKYINLAKPTKIIIHGLIDTSTSPWVGKMAATFHKSSTCNVLVVDWSDASKLIYPQAAGATLEIGNIIGDLIADLKAHDSTILSKIHVIGHSLGAHIGAFAAKRVIERTYTKIARLSGLDPAGPFFENQPSRFKIDKNDAWFVDIIHTDGIFGIRLPHGHTDFFFNCGKFQLNCSDHLELKESSVGCSHRWAYAYYTITILHPQKYLACSDSGSAAKGKCDGKTAFAGYGATARKWGSYYINTNKKGDPIGAVLRVIWASG